MNDLMLDLKLLGKQEQSNPKTNRMREIIKASTNINEIETNKQTNKIQRINKKKKLFL
jgi:hypothetical protein